MLISILWYLLLFNLYIKVGVVELDEFFLLWDHMFATRQHQVEQYLAGLTKK